MNVIYVEMSSASEQIKLPTTHDMEDKGCALFEMTGRVSPYTDIPLFLCTDFVEESVVGHKMMPVLRRLHMVPNSESSEAIIRKVFNKMLWLPTNRSKVDELRV